MARAQGARAQMALAFETTYPHEMNAVPHDFDLIARHIVETGHLILRDACNVIQYRLPIGVVR